MIHRLRALVYPAEGLFMFTLGYLAYVAALDLLIARMGLARPPEFQIYQLPPEIAVAAYGIFRVLAFHPAYRPGYRAWLETTPWQWGKPLPLGPISLSSADAAGLVAVAVSAWILARVSPFVLLGLVLATYLVALAPALWVRGESWLAAAVLFGVGLAVRVWDATAAAHVGILLATYLVGLVALARSLRRWPWPSPWREQRDVAVLMKSAEIAPFQRLGWPFERLGPQFPAVVNSLSARDAILICLLAGWWFHVILARIPILNGRDSFSVMGLSIVGFLAPAVRLLLYLVGYVPPIHVFARIVTLRWLIPSYDQVFLSPLVGALLTLFVPRWLQHSGVAADVAPAVAVSVALIVVFLGGPSRRNWWLTAQHRIVPAIQAGPEFVQVH